MYKNADNKTQLLKNPYSQRIFFCYYKLIIILFGLENSFAFGAAHLTSE
jgi:hypothetical protein